MKRKPEPKRPAVREDDASFARFDVLVRNVLSVSNVTVQKKMKAEKRKRQAKRKRQS